MASEVKTNKVSPSTGTTLSVGDSGDTLALAVDSVTGFNVGSDAAGDVLYNDGTDYTRLAKPGTPADEVLTFATGASAPSWVAAAAGGNTHASMWRVTADFTGIAEPITSNLAEVNSPAGFGVLGASMTQVSGIFTFPATGYWHILYNGSWTGAATAFGYRTIQTTTDNSTYNICSTIRQRIVSMFAAASCDYVFDVVDTSLCKVRFDTAFGGSSASMTTKGSTTEMGTWMTFIRLGDT